MIGFILGIALIGLTFLLGAHWNMGFLGIFLSPGDYVLFLAVPAFLSSRYGLNAALGALLGIRSCSDELRSSALLTTGYVSIIGCVLGMLLTFGSIAGGPEVIGGMIARSLVPIIFGGLLSAWIVALPREANLERSPNAGYAGLGVLSVGLLTSLLSFFVVLFIVSI